MLAVMALLSLSACDSPKPLPPAPDLSSGRWQDKASGFSTAKMLKMCRALNTVADGGKLTSLTDAQIANGTCEMSVLAVETIGRRVDPHQTCVEAARNMVREFRTRFPDHDLRETTGRC